MGIYTNHSYYSGYGYNSNYRDVEPFQGDHFNYHELGIIAAVESAANRDAFMKAIALNELASVEQYGTDQVFYEAVDIGGVFEKIKAFFKKIIDKIHKIFHTFIAQLSAWFKSSADFAKKYEKEIIKKWGLVKNDWEFKGYKFSLPSYLDKKDGSHSTQRETMRNKLKSVHDTIGGTDTEVIKELINNKNEQSLRNALQKIGTVGTDSGVASKADGSGAYSNNTGQADNKTQSDAIDKAIDKFRDDLDGWKDRIRGTIITNLTASTNTSMSAWVLDNIAEPSGSPMDSKEYTEELFKIFRSNEDSKEDVKLSEVGASASVVITYLKDYDKIKEQTEHLESDMVKSIDDLIKAIDKAENELIKSNKDTTDADLKLNREKIIKATSLYQTCWGFVKETQSQAFGALLQALKDKCAQCKEVCVKVIGSSKKMTEESYDYSNSYSDNSFNSFIENVKLV